MWKFGKVTLKKKGNSFAKNSNIITYCVEKKVSDWLTKIGPWLPMHEGDYP